jgi:hypothetical protein
MAGKNHKIKTANILTGCILLYVDNKLKIFDVVLFLYYSYEFYVYHQNACSAPFPG